MQTRIDVASDRDLTGPASASLFQILGFMQIPKFVLVVWTRLGQFELLDAHFQTISRSLEIILVTLGRFEQVFGDADRTQQTRDRHTPTHGETDVRPPARRKMSVPVRAKPHFAADMWSSRGSKLAVDLKRAKDPCKFVACVKDHSKFVAFPRGSHLYVDLNCDKFADY
jgi:hypothetical protein